LSVVVVVDVVVHLTVI